MLAERQPHSFSDRILSTPTTPRVPAQSLALVRALKTAYEQTVQAILCRKDKLPSNKEAGVVDCMVALLEAEDLARRHKLTVA